MRLRASLTALIVGTGVLAFTQLAAADAANEQKLKATKQCVGCELQNADLAGAQIAGANLTDANLSGASLYGADLTTANLTNANLSGTNLRGANLRGARGADFAGAHTDERTTCPNGQQGPC